MENNWESENNDDEFNVTRKAAKIIEKNVRYDSVSMFIKVVGKGL
jgi:hypothetical protein